jgi:tryptophanyl-tRNA synthetase
MPRVFSGIQPTGDLHLGNLLGAVRNWVDDQHEADSFYCIVDLHALTIPKEPGEVGQRTLELAQVLLAIGLDPEVCTLFVQSHVREHSELAWLLQCVTSMGELRRMTQFKDKSEGKDFISAGLFTYPALQAADILLYDTDRVPVGEDQIQHIELTRDVAERFNHRYGETFVLPAAAVPTVGARVMDLQEPTNKMSKSADSPAGTILVTEDLAQVAKKIKRAVTDSDPEVRYDPVAKPGVSNLLSILGAVTGQDPAEAAKGYEQYGPLKADTAEAVVEMLRPIQERIDELRRDPGQTAALLERGAQKAREVASQVVARAKDHIGLLPPA